MAAASAHAVAAAADTYVTELLKIQSTLEEALEAVVKACGLSE